MIWVVQRYQKVTFQTSKSVSAGRIQGKPKPSCVTVTFPLHSEFQLSGPLAPSLDPHPTGATDLGNSLLLLQKTECRGGQELIIQKIIFEVMLSRMLVPKISVLLFRGLLLCFLFVSSCVPGLYSPKLQNQSPLRDKCIQLTGCNKLH